MFDIATYLSGLAVIASLAVATWVVSVVKRDASIVDSMWSVLIFAGAATYFYLQSVRSDRAWVALLLAALWAVRLAVYITTRNWGEEEDRRYQAIRRRNEPHFAFKSVYLVFLLQAVLAWVVSLPLLATAASTNALDALGYIGIVVATVGIAFEAIGDWQLSRFKADPNNRGQVMDRGLWRYTRHPNYFGECCAWWGFYLLALEAGAWWSIVSPLLMTALLLRVSGVALLEKDIAKRRPEYRRYIEQTNAFIPGPRRS